MSVLVDYSSHNALGATIVSGTATTALDALDAIRAVIAAAPPGSTPLPLRIELTLRQW